MSLLNDSYEICMLPHRDIVDDPDGGYRFDEFEGRQFRASIVLTSSGESEKGGNKDAVNLYSVTTERSMALNYNDVFCRMSDGKRFRVTSDAKSTPKSAILDMRQVTAEEWSADR